jgi:hypothetical protein
MNTELLKKVYTAFNARDIDSVLTAMHPEVIWPNGMEGGNVHGHQGIREYWTRQWGIINPRVEPTSFKGKEDGRIVVEVHQLVRDLSGNLLKDAMVQHIYTFKDGLIHSMEICEDEPAT